MKKKLTIVKHYCATALFLFYFKEVIIKDYSIKFRILNINHTTI